MTTIYLIEIQGQYRTPCLTLAQAIREAVFLTQTHTKVTIHRAVLFPETALTSTLTWGITHS